MGCAGSSPSTQTAEGESRFVENLKPEYDYEKTDPHGVWSGGGEFTLGDTRFELPADPVVAVGVHPRRFSRLLEAASAIAGDIRGEDVPVDRLTSAAVESAWPRLLPMLINAAVDSPEDLVDDFFDAGEFPGADLTGVKLRHLDADRRVVAVMGFGHQRPLIRRHRLSLPRDSQWPVAVAFRLFVPSTDAEALAAEFRHACRKARTDERDKNWRARVCGKMAQLETRGGYVVADIWHEASREGIDTLPKKQSLDSVRDMQWRDTAAFETFQDTARAVSVYTRSASMAALTMVFGDMPLRVLEDDAYEFEDVMAAVGTDGGGGFQFDMLQSYTTHGRTLARAGQVDRPVATFEVPNRWLSITRGWNPRAAGRNVRKPRWAVSSPFQKEGAYRQRMIRHYVHEIDDPYSTLHLWTAYPTATARLAFSGARPFKRRELPLSLYMLRPSAARMTLGFRPGGVRGDPGSLVGGLDARMHESFQNYLDDDVKRLYQQWIKAVDLSVNRTDDEEAEEATRLQVGFNGPVDEVIDRARRPKAHLAAEVDLASLAGLITEEMPEGWREATGRVLRRLEGLTWRREGGEYTRRTHLHAGPGESEPLDESAQAAEPTSPQGPPECVTHLVRRIEKVLDFDSHPLDTREERLSATLEKWAGARQSLEEIRDRCGEMTARERRDLRIAMASYHRSLSRVELQRWNLKNAAGRLAEACKLGDREACTSSQMFRHVEPPMAKDLQARGDLLGDEPRDVVYRVAGPLGVSRMERELFTWSEFYELAEDRPDGYSYDHPLARLLGYDAQIGQGRAMEPTDVIPVYADRGLLARHLGGIVRHVDFGLSDAREGRLAVLAEVYQESKGTEKRRGWHVISGERIEDPAATVHVTPAGYVVEVGGERLAPIERCPDDGPTVCLETPAERIDELLETHADLYADAGTVPRSREILAQLASAYRTGGLKQALSRASESSQDGKSSALQIVADGRVPQEVVTHLMSTALFETQTDGDRRRIVGMHFDEFYFEAVE